MNKLYYDTPYVRTFTATVLTCEKGKKYYETVLTQTAFYPEGGGQPSDTGALGPVRVREVHERNGTILHMTESALTPGETVEGSIDWPRRFQNMQEHSGEHLVSGLIHSKFGYDNVGFHMGSEEITIDLNGVITWDELSKIEREANEIIYENREIYAGFPTEEELKNLDYRSKKELTGEIRIVSIPGADTCACCGTHVKRTGEIGIIKFLSLIHYKGGVRIGLLCGGRALADYERRRAQTQAITNLLSSKPEKITDAVEKLKNDLTKAQEKLYALYGRIIEAKVESAGKPEATAPASENLAVYEPDFDSVQLRRLLNRLIEKKRGKNILALAANDDGSYLYLLGSQSEDMRLLSRELNDRLCGKGGGSAQMAQGAFCASPEEICAVLKEKGFIAPAASFGSGVRNLSDYTL